MIHPDAFIHPAAIVENDSIGRGTRIYAFVHILPGAVVGEDCNVNDHCFLEGDVVLGDRVTVKCGNYLWDGLRVGDDAFLGPNVVFTNDARPRSKRYPEQFLGIRVGKGASIGANATILGGITIGDYAMVGMASVVTRSVPPHALVFGNPARPRGWACRCGSRLVSSGEGVWSCECGLVYRDGAPDGLELVSLPEGGA